MADGDLSSTGSAGCSGTASSPPSGFSSGFISGFSFVGWSVDVSSPVGFGFSSPSNII